MVTLEYFTEDDFEQLMAWIPSPAFCLQWGGPGFSYPLTKEQLAAYLQGANQENAQKYIFKAVNQTTEEVIGHISLRDVDREQGFAVAGKVLVGADNARGKGYGTQMMTNLLQFAFDTLALDKINLLVLDFNTSAITCYKKVGFQEENYLHKARKNGEEYWSLIEMGITKSEWEARRSH
ncbi:GNAT family N-acetyltransferase [Gracilibacillus alcaliphilus]|uniref:GNAT family N-acetyltransferase n=1 Tax=Gracilibacillus alcaliphilus TaxID=1401441 RepID=UPI00195B78C0|nr:GNAT family protein [Gracilibacillus alcaliphilus]MBM7675568.1 RimJ/RimL family protein N-acetyltransferase [Gracilibacillus alcaliphilus]